MTSQIYPMRSDSTSLRETSLSTVERADTCRRLTARVVAIKRILIERYRLEGIPMALVREAIADAEAQAWLSGFPHLLLPDFADEILRQLRQKGASSHPEYAQAA